jgi:hypothetical protein
VYPKNKICVCCFRTISFKHYRRIRLKSCFNRWRYILIGLPKLIKLIPLIILPKIILTNNKKPSGPKNPPLYNNNTDFLGFKSLSDLMSQRKAKFLGLQKLLADREKPRPFWKVLKDARKTAEYADNNKTPPLTPLPAII